MEGYYFPHIVIRKGISKPFGRTSKYRNESLGFVNSWFSRTPLRQQMPNPGCSVQFDTVLGCHSRGYIILVKQGSR